MKNLLAAFSTAKPVFGFYLISLVAIMLQGCEKQDDLLADNEKVIRIQNNIAISNVPNMHDPDLNLVKYENFLKYLTSSGRFLMVTQEEFERTSSTDKVVVSIRHDVDNNINGAIKLAYREHKYGIRATYYILHTARYYGETKKDYFRRNDVIINYLKKIQDDFGHEIAFHNDLVTLQVVYNIDPRPFLKTELEWMRSNGLRVSGTCTHGSSYCYIYHYLNTYFWITSPNYGHNFYNFEYIYRNAPYTAQQNPGQHNGHGLEIPADAAIPLSDEPGNTILPPAEGIRIIKDDKSAYGITYDGDYLKTDYNFSDVRIMGNGKRWHMEVEDFSKIQPGKKVIILVHPQFWD